MPRKKEEYDAFISYASEDELVARLVLEALEEWKLKVWFDHGLRLGDPLAESILKGIFRSRVGVLLLSPNYFKKKWTRIEMAHFQTFGTRLMPIRYGIGQAEVDAHGLGAIKAVDAPKKREAFSDKIGKWVAKRARQTRVPQYPESALVVYTAAGRKAQVKYRLVQSSGGSWIFPKDETIDQRPSKEVWAKARVVKEREPAILTVYSHEKPDEERARDTAVYIVEGSTFKSSTKEREVGLFNFRDAKQKLGDHKNRWTAEALVGVLDAARDFVQQREG